MKKLFAVLLFLALMLPSVGASAAEASLETVSKADLEKLVRSNKGKPVMVNFFATWCPPCRAEIPYIVKMQKKYGQKMAFIGLSVDQNDTVGRVKPFLQKLGASYPVYRASSDLIQNFNVTSIPFNVFYDKNGKVGLAGSGVLDEESFEQILIDLTK